jgi:hypothetical protein
MALKFKSNDLVSPVDIDGNEFIFIFDYVNDVSELEPDALLKATDFNFIFEIKKDNISKSIKITNTCPTERNKGLRFNESVEYTLKKKADSVSDTFFDDELYYFDGEPYRLITPEDKTVNKFKIVNGKTYVNIPKYSLVFYNDAFYVKRLNDKNNNGNFIRPIEIRSSSSNGEGHTQYFVDKNNVFDTNINHTYKIVVSDMGKIITLWHKNSEDTFEKIKTFSFAEAMENADIYLTINDDLKSKLCNLRFNFLKSDVI